jgi:hypothetical protein
MAKSIQEFYSFLSFLEGKNIATKRAPEQVDSVVYFCTTELFGKYLDHYVKTKKVAKFMEEFKRSKDITLTSGKGDLPPDYAIYREIYKMTPLAEGESASSIKVEIVEDAFWSYRRNRTVGPASLTRPIARIEFTKDEPPVKKLEVFPASVTSVELLYFKNPVKPKYAYTTVGTKYVYDDDNSVDLEFSMLAYPDLLYRVLSGVGVNLRENQLVQFMELYKSQEQRK